MALYQVDAGLSTFRKPRQLVLNGSSPQNRGLLFAHNAVTARSMINLINPNHSLGSGSGGNEVLGTPTFGGGPTGVPEVRADSTDSGLFHLAPAAWKINPPLTIMAGVRRLGTIGANATIAAMGYSNPSVSPFICWGFAESNNSVDGIGMYWNTSGTLWAPSSGTPEGALPLNEYHIWVGTIANGNQRLWRDGLFVDSAAIATGTINYNVSSYFSVGDGVAATRNPNIAVSHVHAWNRELSIGEITEYSALRPWDLYAIPRRVYFDIGSATGTARTYSYILN